VFAILLATTIATNPALETAPCRVGETHAAAICGTLRVFEDRAAQKGRTIAIHFIDIQAKHSEHRAIVFNPGGPGASATALAEGFADATSGAVASLRDSYDVLLVDNRGTGESAPQQCDFSPANRPELYFRQIWPDELVRSCRDRLASTANLSLYTTSVAADDLDDIRAALGYPKLVLYGGSYGTQFYLDYARRHPDRVESLILGGVAPPHFYILPLPMARGAQTALDDLANACRRARTCATHFPAFAEHFAAVAHRFDAGPVSIVIHDPVTRRSETVQLTKEVFAETIRHEMYFPGGAAYIPVTIERAYSGDFAPLADMVRQMDLLFANILDYGLNLSVSCAEDLPFVTEADLAAYSARTFEGDSRVRAQQRACTLWNVAPAPASYHDPVRSDAPVLMISGSDDPASPPEYGREALTYLPNGRQMLVPGASHDSDLPPCVDATIVAFVRAHSAAGLDLDHCAATYERPAFVTLAYDEPAPGENLAQRTRLLKVMATLMHGKIDRSQLTPTFYEKFSDALVTGLASGLAQLGALQCTVFKGVSGKPDARVYTYLMRFERDNVLVTIVLDGKNQIRGLDFSG
jgi:pimeloyl-ACP methyl ester carboxylesterase